METDHRPPREGYLAGQASHLFTLRVWEEAVTDTDIEWRGRVQHVSSGQVYYFRDWSTLITHVLSMLPAVAGRDASVGEEGRQEAQGKE